MSNKPSSRQKPRRAARSAKPSASKRPRAADGGKPPAPSRSRGPAPKRVSERTAVRGASPLRLPILSDTRRQVPCLTCALCCTYVAVEIDGPSSVRAATDILWYLYHGGVSIYVDDEGWMVQIDTRCRHLGEDNKCGVYESRPPMCRSYDEKSCEVNADEVGVTFHSAAEYLEYLKQHHRRIHTLIAKRYVPPADKLAGGPARKLEPFKPRYEAMRSLGAR